MQPIVNHLKNTPKHLMDRGLGMRQIRKIVNYTLLAIIGIIFPPQ